MKNNLFFKLIFILIFYVNISNSYSSEELKFEATSIEIIDKDKIIIAKAVSYTHLTLPTIYSV